MLWHYEHPSTLPAYSDLQVDRLGMVWIGRYPIPGRQGREWDVFDSQGTYVASVTLPRRFNPTDWLRLGPGNEHR